MFRFKKEIPSLNAFMKGNYIPIEDVSDPVFAQKMMGDGFAIEPTDNQVYAPIAGEIVVLFPTYHAYGIKTKSGIEVLLHLGIDTVELSGDGFETFVEVGSKVKQGDLLGSMNLEKIKEHGKPVTSMCIVTSGQEIKIEKDYDSVSIEDKIAIIV